MSSDDKDGAIRKVRGLQTIADDERCAQGERDNARSLADRLKAKHGITDDDLVEHDGVGGLFDGMFSAFRWGRVVREETNRIWADVDALVDRMLRDEKGAARAEAVNAVFGAIRAKLGDTSTYLPPGTLKDRRDEALYDYFVALDASDRKDRSAWEDPEADPDVARMYETMRLERLYDRVASRVKDSHASLNKLQVEKIVKRVRKERADAAKRAQRTADRERLAGQPCVFCQSAEPVKQPVHDRNTKGQSITYDMDQPVTVHYRGDDDTDPYPAHSRCLIEDRKKATA